MKTNVIPTGIISGLVLVATSFVNIDARGQGGAANTSFTARLEVDSEGRHDLCWPTRLGFEYCVESSDSLEAGDWEENDRIYGWGDEIRWHVFTIQNSSSGNGGAGTPPVDTRMEAHFWISVLDDGGALLTWSVNDNSYRLLEDTISFVDMPLLSRWDTDNFRYSMFTTPGGARLAEYDVHTYSALPAIEKIKIDDLRNAWPEIEENVILPYVNGTYANQGQSGGNGGSLTDGRKFFRIREERIDSDGDGLDDNVEFLKTLTNPFAKFTNPGTISDADLDLDNDGIGNLQEVTEGNDPRDYYNGDFSQLSNMGFRVRVRSTNTSKFGFNGFGDSGGANRRFLKRLFTIERDVNVNIPPRIENGINFFGCSRNMHETIETTVEWVLDEDGFYNTEITDHQVEGNVNASQIHPVNGTTNNCDETWDEDNPNSGNCTFCNSAGTTNPEVISETDTEFIEEDILNLEFEGGGSGTNSHRETTELSNEYTTGELLIDARSNLSKRTWSSFGSSPSPKSSRNLSNNEVRVSLRELEYFFEWQPTSFPFVVVWEEAFKPEGETTRVIAQHQFSNTEFGTASSRMKLEAPRSDGERFVRAVGLEVMSETTLSIYEPGKLTEGSTLVPRLSEDRYLAFVDPNNDFDEGNGGADYSDLVPGEDDDDLVKVDIVLSPVDREHGVAEITLPEGLRAFDPMGRVIGNSELTVRLAAPSGKLASLSNSGAASFYLEGLADFSGGTLGLSYTHSLGSTSDEIELLSLRYVRELSPESEDYISLIAPPKYVHHDGVGAGINDENLFSGFSEAQDRLAVTIKFENSLTNDLIEHASLQTLGGENSTVTSNGMVETSANSRVFTDSFGGRFEIRSVSNFDPSIADILEIALIDPLDESEHLIKLRETDLNSFKFVNRSGQETNLQAKNPNESNNQFRVLIQNASMDDGLDFTLFEEDFENRGILIPMSPTPSGGGLISEPILIANNGDDISDLDPRTLRLMLERANRAEKRQRLRLKAERNARRILLSKVVAPTEPALLSVALERSAAAKLGGRRKHLEDIDMIVSSSAPPGSGIPALGYPPSTLETTLSISDFSKLVRDHSIFYLIAHGGIAGNPYAPNLDDILYQGTFIYTGGFDIGVPNHLLTPTQIKAANGTKVHNLVFLNSCAGANDSDGVATKYANAFLAQNYVSWQRPVIVDSAGTAALTFFRQLDEGKSVLSATAGVRGNSKISSWMASSLTVQPVRIVVFQDNPKVVIDQTP